MRRALVLTAVATILALLGSSNNAAATQIGDTPVGVLGLDPTANKDVFLGDRTNFSWAVFNPTGTRYTVSVTASSSDPDFALEVFPANFSLRNDAVPVRLNVTAPVVGVARSTTINVTFWTITPEAANLSFNVSVVARRAPVTINAFTAFVAIGSIIAIGFVAAFIFERTKIPDLLILILLGVILGPLTLTYFQIVFVPESVLEATAPYFAAVALMMILFDGGLNLSLRQVIRKAHAIGVQTVVPFLGTVFAVAFVTVTILRFDPIVGLLLGAVLGGTSSAVVIGVVRVLQVGEDTKVVLTLESVLTDILCVVSVLAIIELIRGGQGASIAVVFLRLAQAFFVALGIGLAFGIGWLFLLRRASKKPFAYMLTIAMLFILYGVTESAGGSGAMASFVFGMILGNHEDLRKRLRLAWQFVVDERIKQFHAELSFVIRTFFFVFLGLVFTFEIGGESASVFLAGVFAIFLAIAGVRLVTAYVTARMLHRPAGERRVLWTLMGRGLAAAVLASVPFTIPAFTSPATTADLNYQAFMAPYEARFLSITFFIIILTVVVTTLGAATSVRAPLPKPTPTPAGLHDLGFMSRIDLDELRTMETWLETQNGKQPIADDTWRVGAGGETREAKSPDKEDGAS
jgi:cell volume regulation protein A